VATLRGYPLKPIFVAADFSLRLLEWNHLLAKQLRALKGAATIENLKIRFIDQPLQVVATRMTGSES